MHREISTANCAWKLEGNQNFRVCLHSPENVYRKSGDENLFSNHREEKGKCYCIDGGKFSLSPEKELKSFHSRSSEPNFGFSSQHFPSHSSPLSRPAWKVGSCFFSLLPTARSNNVSVFTVYTTTRKATHKLRCGWLTLDTQTKNTENIFSKLFEYGPEREKKKN